MPPALRQGSLPKPIAIQLSCRLPSQLRNAIGTLGKRTPSLQTGRWPDGRLITSKQREHCMQAVISWGELNLPRDKRIGYIDKAHKASDSHDDAQPIKWRQNEEDL